jgi:predicted dehydrogenase
MRTFRIGVIGAGAVAQAAHIPGFAAADNCELTAIADPEKRCLDEVARRGWHFRSVYSDYHRMLRLERLDAVSIATPNALHKPMAVDCLRAGCDILLEKPVALTMREGYAIRAAARRSGRRVMVAFTHRFNPLNLAARAAVRRGRIGPIVTASVRFAHTGPLPGWGRTGWFYEPALAGGWVIFDCASHAVDLLSWYVGPVTAVQAAAATLRKQISLEDTAVILLEFGRRALGYVEVGWASPAGFCGVKLHGDRGMISVDYRRRQTTMLSGRVRPDGVPVMHPTVLRQGGPQDPWPEQMAHFTGLLGSGRKFAVGMDEGLSALKVCLAAYESARTGRRVSL